MRESTYPTEPASPYVHATAWGWFWFQHPAPDSAEMHLMPLLDTDAHAFDMECRCCPVETMPGYFTHNSFDGRERYEYGDAKRH